MVMGTVSSITFTWFSSLEVCLLVADVVVTVGLLCLSQ